MVRQSGSRNSLCRARREIKQYGWLIQWGWKMKIVILPKHYSSHLKYFECGFRWDWPCGSQWVRWRWEFQVTKKSSFVLTDDANWHFQIQLKIGSKYLYMSLVSFAISLPLYLFSFFVFLWRISVVYTPTICHFYVELYIQTNCPYFSSSNDHLISFSITQIRFQMLEDLLLRVSITSSEMNFFFHKSILYWVRFVRIKPRRYTNNPVCTLNLDEL